MHEMLESIQAINVAEEQDGLGKDDGGRNCPIKP